METVNYKIVKQAISSELANFIYQYFLNKRKVAKKLFEERYISEFNIDYGSWSDKQIPNTYSHYADVAMETLLENMIPVMEQETGLKLIPTYSYARIYKNGDTLFRHKDRYSCEVSTTMNLGGERWPIFVEPDSSKGRFEDKKYISDNTPGIKIDLEPGDMLVYSGCEIEHWREKFEGINCGQVFLHYNNIDNMKEDNKFDGRPYLGLPSSFK